MRLFLANDWEIGKRIEKRSSVPVYIP